MEIAEVLLRAEVHVQEAANEQTDPVEKRRYTAALQVLARERFHTRFGTNGPPPNAENVTRVRPPETGGDDGDD